MDVLYWRAISGETLAETNSAGAINNSSYKEYIFFAGRRVAQSIPSSSTVHYSFADHLGSTRVVTDATGTACFQADYLPYGQENTPAGATNTCSTSYKFTSYERDAETGLDYAFARYYNQRTVRFMSADPLAGEASDPQSLNRYAYVRNNPVRFTDPFGMDHFDENGQWVLGNEPGPGPNDPVGCGIDWWSCPPGGGGGGEDSGGGCLGCVGNFSSYMGPIGPPPEPPKPTALPQTQSVNKGCLAEAAGNFALHGGTDALGFILGVGGAAVALFSGYAVALIDSTTPEGVTATSVGSNAIGTGLFIAVANKGSIAKFSARLAEGIPIVGTALAAGQLIYDGINAYNQYQACMAGGN